MTDNHRGAQCGTCPGSPNAPVAMPFIGPDALDRRTFLSRAMLSAAMVA